MSIHRTRRTRTTTLLAGFAAASLAATGVATAVPTEGTEGSVTSAASTGPTVPGDSLPDVSADAGGWPAELTEHTRLFVNPYRSYLVTIRDGEPTLVLSTGWDSCWMMTQHDGVLRYPC